MVFKGEVKIPDFTVKLRKGIFSPRDGVNVWTIGWIVNHGNHAEKHNPKTHFYILVAHNRV
jgi:hypothetical protein